MKYYLNIKHFLKKDRGVFIALFLVIIGGASLYPRYKSTLKPENSQKQLNAQERQIQNLSTEINGIKDSVDKLHLDFSKELSFRDGLKFVLAAEGGLTNDAADSGGLTNLGITHSEYDLYRAKKNFLPNQSHKLV